MHIVDLVSYMTQTLYLVLWLSMPPIVAAASVGILFSLFQALMQLQEQTLSFAIKLVTVFITILLTARWVGAELYNFTIGVFDVIPKIH